MVKAIIIIALLQVMFMADNMLQLAPYSPCFEPNCNIVFDATMPDTFKVCINNETRCTTLGKLRQTVK